MKRVEKLHSKHTHTHMYDAYIIYMCIYTCSTTHESTNPWLFSVGKYFLPYIRSIFYEQRKIYFFYLQFMYFHFCCFYYYHHHFFFVFFSKKSDWIEWYKFTGILLPKLILSIYLKSFFFWSWKSVLLNYLITFWYHIIYLLVGT